MQYGEPQCYKCKMFKSAPKTIGGKALCSAYPNGIPKKIFFESGKCSKAPTSTPKKTTTKKTTKRK